MSAQPFLLRVMPRDKDEYGVALYQQQLRQNNNPKSPRRLVQVWGAPFYAIIDYLIETLKKSGYRATDLSRSRKAPFELDEETGVRLGLLLLALKPPSKIGRIEAIASAIRSMPDEEIYYWFSKCTTKGAARQAPELLSRNVKGMSRFSLPNGLSTNLWHRSGDLNRTDIFFSHRLTPKNS